MKTALYRKYRPSTFDGVIGQDVIVRTLRNQIERGALSHAYLFTGSRGTGKTSCAKIFARAVNCLHPVGGSPCGECEVCRALASPSNLDITEMDAASNNGVDKIRELRENIDYMPSVGRYKVYIVDEVHMLSSSAFNALLKTLEEPPAHVIFVLCTTEVHKLPATILSRCMRFDFRLVPAEKLQALLADIFAREGVKAEDKALAHIARLGEGSVRDTLSVADRCVNAVSGTLTYADVLEITGAGSSEEIASLAESVMDSDAGAVVRKVEDLAARGRSPSQISHELTVLARDLLLLISGAEEDVTASPETLARMKTLASRVGAGYLVKFVKELGGAEAELRYSSSPRIVLECALLSLCDLPGPEHSGGSAPGRAAGTEQGERNSERSDDGNDKTVNAAETANAAEAAEPPQANADGRGGRKEDMKAVSVLGHIRHALRTRGELRLFGEYAALRDDAVRLRGNDFVVSVPASSTEVFAEESRMRTVQACLGDIGDLRLVIEELPPEAETRLDTLLRCAEGLATEVVDGKGRKLRR